MLGVGLGWVGIGWVGVGWIGIALLGVLLRVSLRLLLGIWLLLVLVGRWLALRVLNVVGVGLNVLGARILRALRPWLLRDEGVLSKGRDNQGKCNGEQAGEGKLAAGIVRGMVLS